MRIRVLGCLCLWIASAAVAPAAVLVALTDTNQLIRFESSAPGTILSTVTLTGLLPGDTIRAMDVRPATGQLYGLAVNNPIGADEGRIYRIDPASGIAVPVSTTAFSNTLANTSFYGFEFDPVTDQIRIVNTADQNLRVNPTNGALVLTDSNLVHSTASEEVAGIAYNQNDTNAATATTLYGIDYITDTLVRIGGVDGVPSANGGVLTTIGPLGITTSSRDIGFDIAANGAAYASILTSNEWRLHVVSLTTGTATNLGAIGAGTTIIRGLAVLFSASAGTIRNLNTGENFASIQAAINDADTVAGHIIEVGAGTWSELVTVSKGVTLRGPNFGVHGSTPVRGAEAIVNGALTASTRTSAFNVTANGVTLDGFVMENQTNSSQFGAGIVLGPGTFGSRVRNNIIRNNISGLHLANSSAATPTVIERNSFANNNQPGATGGSAIYSDQFVAVSGGGPLTNVLIDDNSFTSNGTAANGGAAINLSSTVTGSQSKITISNNVFNGNARSLLAFNLVDSSFTHNTSLNSNFSASAELRLFEGVNNLIVTNNILQGNGADLRGMRIGNIGTGSPDTTGVVFECNSITGYGNAGLELDAGAYTGALQATQNWWGSATGPTIASNPGGMGLAIVDPALQVVYAPFATVGTDYEPLTPGFECRPTAILYGVDSANNLLRFNSATPETIESSVGITGLQGGETILGIDFRPTTGELFALGSTNRLYTIDLTTGAATLRAALTPAPGDDNPFTTLSGTFFGVSFNPVPDLAGNPSFRVVSNLDQNLRINANNGQVTTDTNINPVGLDLRASAYTNNDLDPATGVTLYAYDFAGDDLVVTANSNAGTYAPVGVSSGVTSNGDVNLDIQTLPGFNRAFGTISNSARSSLYRFDLVTGVATLIGPVSPNSIILRGLAIQPAGTLSLSAPTYSVGESGPSATITINRIGGTAGTVTVRFRTSNGSATEPADYANTDQIVTFNPGEFSKVVSIPIVGDAQDEFNETLNLALTEPMGGALLLSATSTAVLTITDDDIATPVLTAQASANTGVGQPIFDTASISGLSSVTSGTITFQLFGPNDNGCSGAPIFTSVVPVSANGNYISASYVPTTPGLYTWIASYSGDPEHNAPVTTGCGAQGQTVTATATGLGNISTRLRVETGDNVLIGGFIITGTQPKKVLIRAIGPSLAQFFSGVLANPTLELYEGSTLLASNDDWRSDQESEIIATTIPPSNNLESAIVMTLPANSTGYTAVVRGFNGGTGIGVVEAYDLDRLVDSELANISTRGLVQTGDNVLIAGTIVVGQNTQRVLIRAIGPSLPLGGRMQDPTLELRDSNGSLMQANDNWIDSPDKQAIIDTTVPPSDNFESAIIATLPGNNASYTAIVRGVNNTTGIAVVEVYALP